MSPERAVVWYREEIRASYVLWKNFERLPDNERGYAEYRHRATGMIFVKLPGGKVFVPTYDPPKVEIGPFLIAKQKVSKARRDPGVLQIRLARNLGRPTEDTIRE